MGSNTTPSSPEQDSESDHATDFDDPRLSGSEGEGADPAPNLFPDHGPAPRGADEYASSTSEEEDRAEAVSREFYRATSDPDVHEPYVPQKRVKVRRKNQKSVPEWERGEGDEEEAGESESSSSHRKGRRKHKPRSKWAKLVTAAPKLFISLVVVIMAAFLVGALALILGDKDPGQASTPQSPNLKSDSGGVFTSFITEATRLEAFGTLQAYFAAENWEGKLPYVRDPERVRPLMEDWYGRPENLGTDIPVQISETEYSKQEQIGGRVFIMMLVMVSPHNRIQWCSVEKIGDGTFKIDWEVTELYQQIPLSKFQDSKLQSPTPYRVLIRAASYYNGIFADQGRYRAYSLTNPADPNFKLWAYIERGTPLETQLDSLLPPLTATSAILNLAYPTNPVADDQVILKSIAHPNWFY